LILKDYAGILTQVSSATSVEKCDVFVYHTFKVILAHHICNTFRKNVVYASSKSYGNSTAQNDKSKLDAKRPNVIKVAVLDSRDYVTYIEGHYEVLDIA